jgi:hypothetical protein
MRLNKGNLEDLLNQQSCSNAFESSQLKSIVNSSKYGCLKLVCYYIQGILKYLRGFEEDILRPKEIIESDSE